MTVQVPIFEKSVSKPSKQSTVAEALSGPRLSVKKFVETFEVLAEAEGGIRGLRETVLALAVRGALVAQDSGEGSSESLLKTMEAGRARLSKISRLRGDLAPVTDDEVPFTIPPTWRWVRLGHFGGFLGGGTPSKSTSAFWDGPVPWVSPKDMKRPYISDAEDHISEAAVEGSAVKLIPTGSLLFVVRGMILAHSFPVALTMKPVTVNQDMKALVLAVPATDEYLLRACWAARRRVLERVERSTHGTCRLDTQVVEELPVPLPPLPEQKRIVAKVDELMQFIDDLEAKRAKRREVQIRFRTSALDALTKSEGPDELASAWKRVAEKFDVLFEGTESLGDFRSLVRDLAVRGILTASGKPAPEGSSPSSDGPFSLPSGWRWARLGEVSERTDYGTSQKAHPEPSGIPVLRMNNIQDGRLDVASLKYVPRETEGIDAILLASGDLLFNRTNSYELVGKMAVFSERETYTFASYLLRVRLTPSALPDYVNVYFGSRLCRSTQIEPHITRQTNQANFNGSKLKEVLVPLPPLAEQKRIVAKVEQLMKLCDDLEAQLKAKESTASKLVEAVVRELVA